MAKFTFEVSHHTVDADRDYPMQPLLQITVEEITCIIVRSVESEEWKLWGPEQKLLVGKLDLEPGQQFVQEYTILDDTTPYKYIRRGLMGKTPNGIKCIRTEPEPGD